MSETQAANRERQQYLKEFGWNWQIINPRLKRQTPSFNYGPISLLKPRITMYRQ